MLSSYPEIKRNPSFAEVTAEDVDFFKSVLGSESAILESISSSEAEEDILPFNRDWMNKYQGQTRVVLRPESAQQISQILKYCNDKKLAVVPQGGNTGLVGGSVPVFDEIVISMSRMNEIRSFDEVSGILVVDGGVIMEIAETFLAQPNNLYPVDLGAKG